MIKSALNWILFLVMASTLTGCAANTVLMLPGSGAWEERTAILGPVVACRGGNSDFSETHKECNNWPISVTHMPPPEAHYAELRAKAAEQYHVDPALIALKDITVSYNTELNGVIRGWKAQAIAGQRIAPPSISTAPAR